MIARTFLLDLEKQIKDSLLSLQNEGHKILDIKFMEDVPDEFCAWIIYETETKINRCYEVEQIEQALEGHDWNYNASFKIYGLGKNSLTLSLTKAQVEKLKAIF